MLVLSRWKGESSTAVITPALMKAFLESIGAQVEMPTDVTKVEPLKIVTTVIDVRQVGKARLGYDATFNGERLGRELPIHRTEVVETIERDNTTYEGFKRS